MKKILRNIYRVIRAIVFSAVLMTAGIYALAYILLAMPGVQKSIKEIAEQTLSEQTGGNVEIGSLRFYPFNQLILNDVSIGDPQGAPCIDAKEIGAGINLWRLILKGKIEISFAEIIGLNAHLKQHDPHSPLNIRFLIDAFQSKDKKEPSKFALTINAVVLRGCSVSYDKEWIPAKGDRNVFDANHIRIHDLSADVILPIISNEEVKFNLRRLSLKEESGLEIKSLTAKGVISEKLLSLKGFALEMPNSKLCISDLELPISGYDSILDTLKTRNLNVGIYDTYITPRDFMALCPPLNAFDSSLSIELSAIGNLNSVDISKLHIYSDHYPIDIYLQATADNISNIDNLIADLKQCKITANTTALAQITNPIYTLSGSVREILNSLAEIDVDLSGKINMKDDGASVIGSISTALGEINLDASADKLVKWIPRKIYARIDTDGFNAGELSKLESLGNVAMNAEVKLISEQNTYYGDAKVNIQQLQWGINDLAPISLDISRNRDEAFLKLNANSDALFANLDLAFIEGSNEKSLELTLDIDKFTPSEFIGTFSRWPGYQLSGNLAASIQGNDLNDIIGVLTLDNFNFEDPSGDNPGLSIPHLSISSDIDNDMNQHIAINSNLFRAVIDGHFLYQDIPSMVTEIAREALPQYAAYLPPTTTPAQGDLQAHVTVYPDNTITDFFNLPVRLLVEVPITACIDCKTQTANLSVNIPYLQQGKNKLLRNLSVSASLDGKSQESFANVGGIFPAKDSDVKLSVDANSKDGVINTAISWLFEKAGRYDGTVKLRGNAIRDLAGHAEGISLDVLPSQFFVCDTVWNIAPASVKYKDGAVDVNNIRISNNSQMLSINGRASSMPGDTVFVNLKEIDLDFVFSILNINHVTFGGRATGTAKATNVFSAEPVAFTDGIHVDNLTYNGGLLGDDAMLYSRWINNQKEVTIGADIKEKGKRTATVDGGIWVTRDSLSIGINADKVNIKFLHPFVKAFARDIKGRASGNCLVAGTFKDVDLTGRLYADTIAMLVDYTNVWYGGKDSVLMDSGRIEIPAFKAYDQHGRSAIFSGLLTHNYLHDEKFEFTVRDADNLLLYNVAKNDENPWYGTIYGTGGGSIKGASGYVNMTVDMRTAPKSSFTFTLNKRRDATDYGFLTFTDKRRAERERLEVAKDTVADFIKQFRRRTSQGNNTPSAFNLDMRVTITPDATITLVMDPGSGDKITGRGDGALQLLYSDPGAEMEMYGKYTISDGMYNFTLQDLIIKDFNIRQGSSISFNGDPMNAILNIDAAYRTTTNLSDLDKSFATDRDLNRTNVPVDAVLKVNGELENPDISFDIELPTLTSDVERKVKSIISTDDLLSRQIIYLLALGKFYTPEYMGSEGSGGEFASVASTTISSQLTSILGQISDKWSVAPSFRSDKGDFSDIEFDVALSSRLLNNRLLINGNFGYHDKSTSASTFVGDFDIEYLLNRAGTLRLKAYNHFNDQNYYLRSALTTQGIGVIWRRDFDRIRFKPKSHTESTDTIATPSADTHE